MIGGAENWKVYSKEQVEKFRESVAESMWRVKDPFNREIDGLEGEIYTRLRGDYPLKQVLGWYPPSKPRRHSRDVRDLMFTYLLRNLVLDGLINRDITERMTAIETLAKFVAPVPEPVDENLIPINPR